MIDHWLLITGRTSISVHFPIWTVEIAFSTFESHEIVYGMLFDILAEIVHSTYMYIRCSTLDMAK